MEHGVGGWSVHLVHAAPGWAPGSACQPLEGAGSWQPGWLLSAPAYLGGRGGNGSPRPEHLQLELWCRAQVEEGGLVLGLWAGMGLSPMPVHCRTVPSVGRSGRWTDGWG